MPLHPWIFFFLNVGKSRSFSIADVDVTHTWSNEPVRNIAKPNEYPMFPSALKPLWRIFAIGASGASGRRLSFSMESDGGFQV